MPTCRSMTPFVITLLGAITTTQAAFSKEFSESDFRGICVQAIDHDARALEWFDAGELRITHDYPIPVLRLKSPNKSVPLQVHLVLDRGTDKDAEIPKFAGACLGSGLPPNFLGFTPPSSSDSSGNIDFNSKGYPSVAISFELKGLKHTTWHNTNGTGNDSVWMARYSGSSPPLPGPHDWACWKKKSVAINKTNTVISFVMCHALTPWRHQYQYALHMQQVGNEQFPVDIGIDPRIVDHPN
jgi:hypothetical protein